MELRSMFQNIFGNKKNNVVVKQDYKLLNNYSSSYTPVGTDVFDNAVARECINVIATHSAKLLPKHIKGNADRVKGDIDFLLSKKPNPIMTKFDFIYRTVAILYTYNNAFVYIAKNNDGRITGFYPVIATKYDLYEGKNNKPYLRFRFVNGKEYTLPYEDLIHIRRFYNRNDIYGENNQALINPLETLVISNDGIKNSIKLTNSLRGILHYENAMLKEEDLRKNRDNFVNDYLNIADKSGIATLDSKAKFEAIDMKPVVLDNEQLKEVKANVYEYFGINENIIQSKYTAEQWNSFYESVIEPLAIQLSDVFTVKIFGEKSMRDGNQIVFTTNRLQYATMDSKIRVIKEMGSLGLLTKNEAREIVDLPALDGEEGLKIIQSLNNIDSSIANEYQGGND